MRSINAHAREEQHRADRHHHGRDHDLDGCAMPTAVITESSENTMSSSITCTIVPTTRRVAAADGLLPSSLSWIPRRLRDPEQPAAEQDHAAPVTSGRPR